MLANLRKRLNKAWRSIVAKNAPRTGKSARRGNAKSCYQKYQKTPFVYSTAYRDWKRANTVGAGKAKEHRVH